MMYNEMHMFGFGHAAKNELLIDIGSGSVGMALAYYGESVPIIRAASRKEFTIEEYPDFSRFFDQILHGVLAAGRAIIRDPHYTKPERAYCYLPSVVYFSEVRSVTFKQKEPFKVTEALLRELARKEHEKFKTEPHFQNIQLPKSEPYILEEKIMSVRLNGYEVDDPFEHKTEELTFSFYISYAPKDIVDTLIDIIQKLFHAPVHFHSHVYALYDSLRGVSDEKANLTLIAITGEVTDIVVVEGGELSALTSFPYGTRTLVRDTAHVLKSDVDDARSRLRLYEEGRLDEKGAQELLSALREARLIWQEKIKTALQSAHLEHRIPITCYITGIGHTVPVFKRWLDESGQDIFVYNQNMHIEIVDSRLLGQSYKTGKGAHPDSLISSLAVFTKKIL